MKFSILMLLNPFYWLVLGASVLVGLNGCNTSDRTPDSPSPSDAIPSVDNSVPPPSQTLQTPPANESPPLTPQPSAPVPPEETRSSVVLEQTLISEQGLGPAKLGMTLAELKQAMGPAVEFHPQSPFIVDFDAIAVQYDNETLFYLLHLAGNPLQDNDNLQGIVTTHPLYQTSGGIGVGSTVQLAETIYGKATLSYNTENESREYVRFEQHPATNISFGTQGIEPGLSTSLSEFLGIYPESSGQYHETETYQPDATIQAVLLVCLSTSCSQ